MSRQFIKSKRIFFLPRPRLSNIKPGDLELKPRWLWKMTTGEKEMVGTARSEGEKRKRGRQKSWEEEDEEAQQTNGLM